MCRSVNIVRTQKCLAFGIVGIIVFGNFHCLRRGCLPACLRRKQWVHTMVGTINKYNDVHSQHRRCPIVQLYWNLNRLWDCLLAKDTVFCMTGVFVRNFLVQCFFPEYIQIIGLLAANVCIQITSKYGPLSVAC